MDFIRVKRQVRYQNMDIDRISCLPDELLVNILDFLSLKEAVATSLVSSRWRNLWHFHSRLDFDFSKIIKKLERNRDIPAANYRERRKKILEALEPVYVESVERILESHKGSSVHEFRISFALGKRYKVYIDKWLEFALARNVRRLELDLDHIYFRNRKDRYSFPDEYSTISTTLNNGHYHQISSPCWSLRSCGIAHFKCLESLRLSGVRVGGEAIENLLYTLCPVLEHLSVAESPILVNLKVSGPSLMLKHLEICGCRKLKSLRVSDLVNLVSFKYRGRHPKKIVKIEHVPRLVEADCEVCIISDRSCPLAMFSGCLVQLQVLTLRITRFYGIRSYRVPQKLLSLKKLVVEFFSVEGYSHLPLCSLIDASPHLEKLVLQEKSIDPQLVQKDCTINKSWISPHYNLKEVEFVGYCGEFNDLELVVHLLEKAVVLEKIIIHPPVTDFPLLTCAENHWHRWQLRCLRMRAESQLQGKIKRPQVELVIV